jgi:hypothetical protein
MAAKAKQTALDKMGAALDGAHAHLDKAQALHDAFGVALKNIDWALAAAQYVPIPGVQQACEALRRFAGCLSTISDGAQDALDFGANMLETADNMRRIVETAQRLKGPLRELLKKEVEAVSALIVDGTEALTKFGKRGFIAAMIKAAKTAKTFGQISLKLKQKFDKIQRLMAEAQLNLTLDLTEKQFATEAAVAKQVEAILQEQGGDAKKPADVEKAAAAVAKDEGALEKIKAEAGLGETLFRAEMDALREEAEARHTEQMGAHAATQAGLEKLAFRTQSTKLLDSYEWCDAEGNTCKKSAAVLGEGAFGKTYRMRHKLDGRLVAVKVVNLARAARERIDIKKMQAEAQAMTRLCQRP